MFWLERPPYLRWIAAGLVVAGAAVIDLAEEATVPYPFVVATLAEGAAVGPDDVEWRDVPAGLLGEPAATSGFATHELAAGDPLVAGAVTDATRVPAGWWAVPVDLPSGAVVGGAVRLVAVEPPIDVDGVVAAPAESGPFSVAAPGLVAVPPESAALVAQAAVSGRLVVLMGT